MFYFFSLYLNILSLFFYLFIIYFSLSLSLLGSNNNQSNHHQQNQSPQPMDINPSSQKKIPYHNSTTNPPCTKNPPPIPQSPQTHHLHTHHINLTIHTTTTIDPTATNPQHKPYHWPKTYHPFHNHTTTNKNPPIIPNPTSHESQNPQTKPMNP